LFGMVLIISGLVLNVWYKGRLKQWKQLMISD
jgi:hypothetical protein